MLKYIICYLFINFTNLTNKLYFRACSANFMKTKTDIHFGIIMISVVMFEIIFMYLQSICGPLFFLPSCLYKTNRKKHYFSKKDLIKIDNELAYVIYN